MPQIFMSEKDIKRLHFAYSVLTSLLLTVTLILIAFSCVSIYKGDATEPFTPESISSAFRRIAVPVFICLSVILGGVILNIALPTEKKKVKGKVSKEVTLSRLSARLDLDNLTVESGAGILIRRTVRKILSSLIAVDLIVHCVITLVYLLDPSSFPANDINSEIISATLAVLFNLLIPFVLTVIVMLINSKLTSDELVLVKRALAEQSANGVKYEKPNEKPSFIKKTQLFFTKNEKTLVRASRIVLTVIGIVFIGLGIWNGGANDVVQKAINICTECIGLG